MRLPLIEGTIERRLLVNYRVDPVVVARMLPAPFRPQIVGEYAVAGICLIRLGDMRIKGLPRRFGLRSENAAHRIAVEQDTANGPRPAVFIPRRDSASLVNRLVGGRLFPGEHHPATFHVHETAQELRVAFAARDGSTHADVQVRVSDQLPGSDLFADPAAASALFERGALGWSPTRDPSRFDGLELQARTWRVEPVEIMHADSSFFDDPAAFPPGSATLDSALLMRQVPVSWAATEQLRTSTPVR